MRRHHPMPCKTGTIFTVAGVGRQRTDHAARRRLADSRQRRRTRGRHRNGRESLQQHCGRGNACAYPGRPSDHRGLPGVYPVSETITIDFPVDLIGSNVLELDSSGWPTGVVRNGTATVVEGSAALGASALVSIGRTDGAVVTAVNVRGFTFVGSPGGGNDVNLNQVQDFTLTGNVVTGPSGVTTTNEGISPVASSGLIVGNYISGMGCGNCLRAGYPASPASIVFSGNRSVQNRNAGLLLGGASYGIPEAGDQLSVLVSGNDISNNTGSSSDVGLRIFVIRKDPPDTQSDGNVQAIILGNRLVGNQIGVSLDAGFPYRQTAIPPPNGPLTCDTRVFTGTLDVTFLGNTLSGSLLMPALVSFTRAQTTLSPATVSSWQYLHNATYSIVDPQETLAGYTKDNPSADPFVGGLCAADTVHEPLNNTLIYNGAVVH